MRGSTTVAQRLRSTVLRLAAFFRWAGFVLAAALCAADVVAEAGRFAAAVLRLPLVRLRFFAGVLVSVFVTQRVRVT